MQTSPRCLLLLAFLLAPACVNPNSQNGGVTAGREGGASDASWDARVTVDASSADVVGPDRPPPVDGPGVAPADASAGGDAPAGGDTAPVVVTPDAPVVVTPDAPVVVVPPDAPPPDPCLSCPAPPAMADATCVGGVCGFRCRSGRTCGQSCIPDTQPCGGACPSSHPTLCGSTCLTSDQCCDSSTCSTCRECIGNVCAPEAAGAERNNECGGKACNGSAACRTCSPGEGPTCSNGALRVCNATGSGFTVVTDPCQDVDGVAVGCHGTECNLCKPSVAFDCQNTGPNDENGSATGQLLVCNAQGTGTNPRQCATSGINQPCLGKVCADCHADEARCINNNTDMQQCDGGKWGSGAGNVLHCPGGCTVNDPTDPLHPFCN